MVGSERSASFFRASGSQHFSRNREAIGDEKSFSMRLIAGNANPELSLEVAQCLKVELTPAKVGSFPNGETSIQILENIRGDDVYIIQPTAGSENIDINTALMELLLLIHTLRLSSAKRITAVMPYFAYSRQDRKTSPRVPISASAVAQLIQSMGVDRIITVDLHCGQIQGFFHNIPLDNLLMFPEFTAFLKAEPWFDPGKTAIISPDAGGVERARKLADAVGARHIVTILKRRVKAGEVESMQTVGDVKGYNCVIVDDMVDTAGTLVCACKLLKDLGALRVIACITHGLLSDPAMDRIDGCDALDALVVSDSIPVLNKVSKSSKLIPISLAPMLAEAISRLHSEEALSTMFLKL